MTPLDVLNWLMFVPAFMLSLGLWLFPILFVLVGLYAVARYLLWPALCDFGNWLGRP
jgi:hypothetical protein